MPVDGGLPRGFLNLLVPAIDRMDLVVPKYHANGKCLWRRTDWVFERPAGPNHHSNEVLQWLSGMVPRAWFTCLKTAATPRHGVAAQRDALVLVGLLGIASALLGAFVGLVS
jgi:hypothetical protein